MGYRLILGRREVTFAGRLGWKLGCVLERLIPDDGVLRASGVEVVIEVSIGTTVEEPDDDLDSLDAGVGAGAKRSWFAPDAPDASVLPSRYAARLMAVALLVIPSPRPGLLFNFVKSTADHLLSSSFVSCLSEGIAPSLALELGRSSSSCRTLRTGDFGAEAEAGEPGTAARKGAALLNEEDI